MDSPPLRVQAGLPKGPEMRALVLNLLRTMPQPVTRQTIGPAVAKHLGLKEEQLAVREPGTDRSYVDWISSWACNNLKHIGVCEQPSRGLYQLTELGRTISSAEVERLHRERTREHYAKKKAEAKSSIETESNDEEPDESLDDDWTRQLLDRLSAVSPQGFEHLTGALLEAAGFHDVAVTRQTADGGIDVVAVYRPQGLISFRTTVQCKRWSGSAGADRVQAFQGASMGKADRGILITTGQFTPAAQAQAKSPGAFQIDLIDGEALCELLKEYSLGVRVTRRTVEDILIDETYFNQFDRSPDSDQEQPR